MKTNAMPDNCQAKAIEKDSISFFARSGSNITITPRRVTKI